MAYEPWQAGMRITAERLDNISATWRPYVPLWLATTTNPSIGGAGGSLAGQYARIGKTIIANIKIVFGTGFSLGSGTYRWSLPSNMQNGIVSGTLSLFKVGGADLSGVLMSGGTADRVQAVGPGGSSNWGSGTIPSPVAGDTFLLMATYQEA